MNTCAIKSEKMANTRKLDEDFPREAPKDNHQSSSSFAAYQNPDTTNDSFPSTLSTSSNSKEKKRAHQEIQDDDYGKSKDGKSTSSSFASSSLATSTSSNDNCCLEGIEAKKSRPSSTIDIPDDNQDDNHDRTLMQNSQVCALKKEGEDPHSSRAGVKAPRRKRKSFDERLAELTAFKTKHGHCNVPRTPSSDYLSLSQWCNQVMVSYKKIQEGKTSNRPLSQEQIGKLEAFGFEWSRNSTFEERLADLATFKAKHGHCNPPHSASSSEYKSLSQWCGHVRHCNKQIKDGKTPNRPFSQDQIGRLDTLGFEWVVRNNTCTRFEKRLADLAEFKAKHGHCNPPYSSSSEYKSLGQWCNHVRCCYKQIQEGKTPNRPLSQDQIGRLEALGFEWDRKQKSVKK
jgi:hypothetical protein